MVRSIVDPLGQLEASTDLFVMLLEQFSKFRQLTEQMLAPFIDPFNVRVRNTKSDTKGDPCLSDFVDADVQKKFHEFERLQRGFVPASFAHLCAILKRHLEKFPGSYEVALADGHSVQVLVAAIVAARLGLAKFKVFAAYNQLEEVLPELNRILTHPTNATFISVLGHELGEWQPLQGLSAFDTVEDFLKFCGTNGIEVIPNNLVDPGMGGWEGLRRSAATCLQEHASPRRASQPRDVFDRQACLMMRSPAGFAAIAAATRWRGVTHAIGGKELKTKYIARFAKDLVLPNGHWLTSFATQHRVIGSPGTHYIGDPGVLAKPLVKQRVGLMLAIAAMIDDYLTVRIANGEKLTEADREFVCALSFSTQGSADRKLTNGQVSVAERAHLLWQMQNALRTGLVQIPRYEVQYDAVMFDVLGKLSAEEGGGRGAGLVGPDLTTMNLLIKMQEASGSGLGGGPIFLGIDPVSLGYTPLRIVDLSRMDLFRRILAAIVEAAVRSILAEMAADIRAHKRQSLLEHAQAA